jgi:iron complex transport system ATP-binding protein
VTSSTQTSVLACRDLSVGYGDHSILSDISLSFEAGQFISLLGPNGAGKTTLLRTFSRHLAPLGGRIEVLGRPLARLSAMELAQSMAVVLTDKVSPPLFSVFEFTALGRYPHTDFLGRLRPADIEAVENALAAVHAEALAHRPFSDLSDGERQKVLVARALAQQPRLLLLDEPTIHLDLKHRVEVLGILRDLCRTRGITVVASLHDVDVAAKVSDRVALIKSGGLSAWGPPETVLTGPAVSSLYDFREAEFCNQLGGIELRGDGSRGRVFVAAGMGTGTQVYRMLAKRGFGIATGVLHENDLDYYVAKSLGARCTTCPSMTAPDAGAVAAAARDLEDCRMVIDCGFDQGPLNRENMNLLKTALETGKPVLTLRKNGLDGTNGAKGRLIRCSAPTELLAAMDRLFPEKTGTRESMPFTSVAPIEVDMEIQ